MPITIGTHGIYLAFGKHFYVHTVTFYNNSVEGLRISIFPVVQPPKKLLTSMVYLLYTAGMWQDGDS